MKYYDDSSISYKMPYCTVMLFVALHYTMMRYILMFSHYAIMHYSDINSVYSTVYNIGINRLRYDTMVNY